MPVLTHFRWLAPIYDRLFGNHIREEWSDLLEMPVSGRLLDAGGGTGRVTEKLDCTGCLKVVVDRSLPMLRQAIGKPGLSLCYADTSALPFRDGAFERILMVDALHHVGPQSESVSEMVRVLSDGGILMIEEPNYHSRWVKVIALVEKLAGMRSIFLYPAQISALFNKKDGKVTVHLKDYSAWVILKRQRQDGNLGG